MAARGNAHGIRSILVEALASIGLAEPGGGRDGAPPSHEVGENLDELHAEHPAPPERARVALEAAPRGPSVA
jgi:hypothetical protein